MKTHQEIDRRSLVLAKKIVEKIEQGRPEGAVARAIDVCQRWADQSSSRYQGEWLEILREPWINVRSVLLDPSDQGQRLRQSNPFGFVLTPQERWSIYQNWRTDEAA